MPHATIDERIAEAIPIHRNDMFLYRRKEQNGEVVVSKQHPELQQLVLNSTMVDILEKCDGKNTVQEVFATLYRKYKNAVSRRDLESDVYSALHSLWRLGLVEWLNHHPFSNMYVLSGNDYDYCLLTEDEAVSAVLRFEGDIYEPYLQPSIFQSERAIRQNTFSFNESFFQMIRNKKCSAMVSLITPVFYNTTLLRMRYLSHDDLMTTDDLKHFLSWCEDKIGEILNKKYTGIILIGDTISPKAQQKLCEIGFSHCGKLNNERSEIDNPIDIYFFKHNSP